MQPYRPPPTPEAVTEAALAEVYEVLSAWQRGELPDDDAARRVRALGARAVHALASRQ